MAAVVRGVDTIDVTPAVREAWRAHLGAYYPLLNPVDRFWFANAPYTLGAIQAGWQQLPPAHQEMYRQAWALALPMMLQLVDPVLQTSQPPDTPGMGSVGEVVNQRIEQQQQQAQQAAGELSAEAAAQQELFNHSVNLQLLTNMSTIGANNTIGLMHAYSGMS